MLFFSYRFTDIWTGTHVSFARSTNGDVYAWGLNNYYQLGIGDMMNNSVPELVKSLSASKKWTSIAGGQHHSVAANEDGRILH
jgi:regulator of chromosome condensation